MPLFGNRTAKKAPEAEKKAPVSSGGAGYAWHPDKDDKNKQRQKGNQSVVRSMNEQAATMAMIPRRRDVENMLGKAKENSFGGLKKNSTTYRPVLDHLDALNKYLDSTELAQTPDGMTNQLDQVIGLMQNLEQSVINYIKVKQNNKKAAYMQNILLPVIRNVRVTVISKINQYKVHPPFIHPKWYIIASGPPNKSRQLDDSMSTGNTGKGGINEVQFFRLNYSEEGVFKQTKDQIKPVELGQGSMNEVSEYYTAKSAGIDLNDARLAERNVAMYRLDRLLGGDIIPKTEFAMRNFGGQEVKGTVMQKAAGMSAGKLAQTKMVGSQSEKVGEKASHVSVTDPNLQRLMSRLQLLDALAYQVDRHQGNFFIEFDEKGNVIGVKGIDNDMAFGTRTDITNYKSAQEFSGIARFVDKEMAQRILALRPEDLQAALSDLLSDSEMDALVERLLKLQQELKSVKLLEPDEWNEMTAKAMVKDHLSKMDGGRDSYYGRLAGEMIKP